MNQADYLKQDAVGLAGLIAGREVSAAEVLEAAVTRMEAVNPKVNAVVLSLVDEARAQVKDGTPAGPLGGVPYLIKDLVHMRGAVTTSGSRLHKDRVAEADNASARLYRQAGLVLFGKTNTPEFGLEPVTEPELFGPSRNPWDLERTPGGSSGGASAAVAAGIVPAANASDGGGSIRTPASCCGLFGLKPSRGRTSYAPGNEGWGGFSVNHAVTRSVRDSAALLDAICAPQVGDPYCAPPPERPFSEEVRRGPGRLRIALFDGAIIGGDIDPECAEAVRDTGRLLQSLGHEVTEAALPGDIQPTRAASGTKAGSIICRRRRDGPTRAAKRIHAQFDRHHEHQGRRRQIDDRHGAGRDAVGVPRQERADHRFGLAGQRQLDADDVDAATQAAVGCDHHRRSARQHSAATPAARLAEVRGRRQFRYRRRQRALFDPERHAADAV